jgi:hypothetical protein
VAAPGREGAGNPGALGDPVPASLNVQQVLPISPGAALRRSLLAWGWGQVANGDSRGWLGLPVQLGLLAGFAWLAPQLAPGTGVGILFLLGVALLAIWTAVPLHAYRQATRLRTTAGLPAGDGAAITLLWLAPVAIVASSLFWGLGGRFAEPSSVLAGYLAAWHGDLPADGTAHLLGPGSPDVVAETWQRQEAALHNELVLLAVREGAASGIDPGSPLRTVRWVDGGELADGRRVILVEVARRETERGHLFGILPTSTQRLVTIARLGQVELVRVPLAGPLPEGPWAEAWRIAGIEVAGIALGTLTQAAPGSP